MKNGAARFLAAAMMAGGVAATSGTARAQTAPLPPSADPGAIGRGLIERQRDLPRPEPLPAQPPVTGDANLPDAGELPAAGVVFELRAVTFDSSSFLSAEVLAAIAAPRIGTQVSIADLRTIAAEVNALYAARGIVTARAYVPPQKIADGAVRIALVEGRLGAMNIAEGRYTASDYVRSRIRIAPGQVIDLDQVRRQINLFNRTNDIRLQAQLQPGREVGLTDVLLSIAEPARNTVQLFADNQGYESTGRYQGGVALRRSALFVDGDRLNLYGSLSDGGITGSISYNMALGTARLGATYARSQITVTQGPSASLDIEGFSDTASINFAQPIAERDGWHATFVATGSYTASENRLSDTVVGQSWVYKATGGFAFGFELRGGGSLGLNLTGSVASAEDSLEGAGRDFPMFNADLAGVAPIARGLSLRVAAAAQHAVSDFIPSNQLFQLGGQGSVRGFQPGTASGTSGYYSQTELHAALPAASGTDLFAFIDSGKAYSRDYGDRALTSLGVGFRLPVWRFDFEASLGLPVSKLRQSEDRHRVDARLVLGF